MQRDNTNAASPAFTRRSFLKTSAAVSMASVVANLGTNFAHAAGSDVLKIGLIGCGGRGSGAGPQALEGAEIAGAKAQLWAIGDIFEGPAKNQAKKFDVPAERTFAGLDNYKGVIDSGIDIVVIATPPGFRPIHFKYAIEKGKHVFMEKPVAVDPTGIRMIMAASEEATQKKLSVVAGTQRRHESNYTDTIKAIHDGEIGDILHMSVYWNGGGIWSRPRTPGQTDAEYQINNWYHYVWLCGDQICEQHIHNLDVANWVMGSHPTSAYGMGGRQVRRNTPGQIWDHFAIEYVYPNGGRVLSFCRHWGQSDDDVSEFAIGTKGTSNPGGWTQVKGGARKNFKGGRSGYVQEHANLIKSILDGKPVNEGKQVAESTLTAIIGRMSCYTGRRVKWDWALNESKLDTMPKDLDLKTSKLEEPAIPMPDREELV
jgi:predicted dehydrogenase